MSIFAKALAGGHWELAALCLLIGALRAARKAAQGKLAGLGIEHGR